MTLSPPDRYKLLAKLAPADPKEFRFLNQTIQSPETPAAKPRKPRIGDVLRALRRPKIANRRFMGDICAPFSKP